MFWKVLNSEGCLEHGKLLIYKGKVELSTGMWFVSAIIIQSRGACPLIENVENRGFRGFRFRGTTNWDMNEILEEELRTKEQTGPGWPAAFLAPAWDRVSAWGES
jgi:hypothetical protein